MGASCGRGLGSCFDAASKLLLGQVPQVPAALTPQSREHATSSTASPASAATPRSCAACSKRSEETSQGKQGRWLCRACLRAEDESNFESLTVEERRGLDFLSITLDVVPWTYWKPGEQPAEILDWMFLGDLNEALDIDLLRFKGITSVLNLVNWWELVSKRPDIPELECYFGAENIVYQECDSEDRLFFDIVERVWPVCRRFLEVCRKEGRKVIVHCKAGHNRSACIVVCWLVECEGMDLLKAASHVQRLRGTILSNHGFRLQLVKLALRLQRLGTLDETAQPPAAVIPTPSTPPCRQEDFDETAKYRSEEGHAQPTTMRRLISTRRLSVKYDRPSHDFGAKSGIRLNAVVSRRKSANSMITEELQCWVSCRTLSMELLACLWHQGKNFLEEYEYTTSPPTVIGSGFSGDVSLCRRKGQTYARCVKSFDLKNLDESRQEKLKNEAVIYLSLEHPNIARLFDVFIDKSECSLVMQFCSGGTLQEALKQRGAYTDDDFQDVAVQMLRAVHYIHRAGIVHRDIKPRNFVYEAGHETLKLIDFGFSCKGALADAGALQGCMGTLGYLAPEVAATSTAQGNYSEKCDLWSLGCVFFELVMGMPAFHREAGQCDGYTEEVVLREIQACTSESVAKLLGAVPSFARPLVERMLAVKPAERPSAREALDDGCLANARWRLSMPRHALAVPEVLVRFRQHGRASKTSRAYALARARTPTTLPWADFVVLRDTFRKFDAVKLHGTIDLEAFVAVVSNLGMDACSPNDDIVGAGLRASPEEAQKIWKAVCGEQEWLSYCEFLSVLMPLEEDVFQDEPSSPSSPRRKSIETPPMVAMKAWDSSRPISDFLPMIHSAERAFRTQFFSEETSIRDLVSAMTEGHLRYAFVRYNSGKSAFFDYMDISHYLIKAAESGHKLSDAARRVSSMLVGALANISGHCAFHAVSRSTPLAEVLKLISGTGSTGLCIRRVPITDESGEVVDVFSCLDFLRLAQSFVAPRAILKSRSARAFDRRGTIMNDSVLANSSLLNAFRAMDTAHVTACPATTRELSGSCGGVVAINVIAVADLKWVFKYEAFDVLDSTVSDFLSWRVSVTSGGKSISMRQRQQMSRFNVVSVDEDDSLLVLAQRMLSSGVQRIFLSCEELARIVGMVSSRDILSEVLEQLID